jgi:VanZ like family
MDDDLPSGAATGQLVLQQRLSTEGLRAGTRHGRGRTAGQDRRARLVRRAQTVGVLMSLAVVARLVFTPEGQGWAWGSPFVEARWYLTGLDSTSTMLQLVGNLALLVVPAALAVLRWPGLARFRRLAGISLAAGSAIEFLQWLLPLGRVVSPLDAVLNATGALAAGLVAAHLRSISGRRTTTPVGVTACR